MRAVDELIPGRRWLDIQRCGGVQIYDPGERCSCYEPISSALLALGSSIGLAAPAAAAGTAAAVAPEVAAGAAAAGSAFAGTAAGAALPAAVPAAAAGGGLLGEVGPVLGLAGTGISAIGGMRQSEYQAAVARANAQALQDKANQDAAVGEQKAIQLQRQSDYVQSQYRARMASSGSAAAGPDATLADIAGQGQYNTLSALYQGLTTSAADRRQADIDLFGAQNVEAAAPIAAAGTVLAGLSSFADKRARNKYFTTTGDAPLSGLAA